jgi:hypothetical protein
VSQEALLQAVLQELAGAKVGVDVPLPILFMLVANAQLALRHPANAASDQAGVLRRWIDALFAPGDDPLDPGLAAFFPALAEVIRRGFNPAHDSPRFPRSAIILPGEI